MASKEERTIIDEANITVASDRTIESLDKITQVIVACKLQKKEFTPSALKKLIKRLKTEPSEEELGNIHNRAELAYVTLKNQKKIEKDNIKEIPDQLPDYIIECVDAEGERTGNYMIDYIKYSDFLHAKFHIHNLKKNLFVYDENTNTHKPHVNDIETHCRNTFKNFGICAKLSSIEIETLTHVKSMGKIDKYPFVGKIGTIHVANGCLDLRTGILSDPSPDDMYDYRIETAYKTFDETPELNAFLSIYGEAGKETIDVLAKAIWQRAYHDTLKEITVLYGPKDSGKTTCAEFVQMTLDGDMSSKNNVSRALLQDLLQRFGYADLEGKLMNIGDDLPDMFVKNSTKINELVGSVVRHVEKKGIDGYDAVVTAYHLFTTNNLPPLDDDDNVIWGKIRLVEFENVLNPKDRKPRQLLFTQTMREQLLFRAVVTAIAYNSNPYVNPQSAETVRAKWHESSTDVDAFMAEGLNPDVFNTETTLDAIKSHYETWCRMSGRKVYMKYLYKRLQPYFHKTSKGNVYRIAIKQFPIAATCSDKQETLAKDISFGTTAQ